MPNDTGFAVMYKKLVDRGFESDPQRLAQVRQELLGQLSAQDPSARTTRLWTNPTTCDKIHSEREPGEHRNEIE